MNRRQALRPMMAFGLLGLASAFGPRTLHAATATAPAAAKAKAAQPTLEVWKSPTCGCCKDWIDHVQAAGFGVVVHDVGNTTARARLGVRPQYGSCHTARVEGYVIEGHVSAEDIQKLLKQRPKALGLAVPGMPIGSPGMDGPEYGGRQDAYEVLLLTADGASSVFRRVGKRAV